MKDHLGGIRDTRYIIDNWRREQEEVEQPREKKRAIRKAQYPAKVRAPTNISKYDGSSNPGVWLEDYHLVAWWG
jgi:hypothetical protein